MQLQLISFALIILHCMDYTGCQQHSGSRHWQHKREYYKCSTRQPDFSCTRRILTFKFTILDSNTVLLSTETGWGGLTNQLAGSALAITRAVSFFRFVTTYFNFCFSNVGSINLSVAYEYSAPLIFSHLLHIFHIFDHIISCVVRFVLR